MSHDIFRILGIPAAAPATVAAKPQPPPLPDDHPCAGCRVLDTHCGVPYCFLPKCNRKIFDKNDEEVPSNA